MSRKSVKSWGFVAVLAAVLAVAIIAVLVYDIAQS